LSGHIVDLKDAGDPVGNARLYQQEWVDELAMLDIAVTAGFDLQWLLR